jgi:hypothetical protein
VTSTNNSPEKLKRKLVEEVVSNWYTYNQLYKAANFYRYLGTTLSILTFAIGGVLSYGLIWDAFPNRYMIVLAVSISVISAIQSVIRPGATQRELRDAAAEYKDLCERGQLTLQIEFEDTDLSAVYNKVTSFNTERRELNKDSPDVSSLWYHYIKHRKSADGLGEICVDDDEFAAIMGNSLD